MWLVPTIAWNMKRRATWVETVGNGFDKVLVFVPLCSRNANCASVNTPLVACFVFSLAVCAAPVSGEAQCLGDRGPVQNRREGEDQQLYRHGRRYNRGRVRCI